MKTILQAAQIKCIGLSLKLKDRPNIKSKDFKIKNWLQFHEYLNVIYTRFLLRIVPIILMRRMFL